MKRLWTLGLLAPICYALLWAAPLTAQNKIQCWTDNQGQRMCGDRVPPEYADKERKVMNDQGVVVETRRGAKTPEELAEEERKAKEAADVKKRAEYDRALLESFRTVKDIESMRDERLILLDGRLAASNKSLADNEEALKNLQERADALQKAEKPVDERLAKQIKQFTRSLKDNQRSIENNAREREAIKTKFDADIARFNELRPPAATAAPAAKKTGS